MNYEKLKIPYVNQRAVEQSPEANVSGLILLLTEQHSTLQKGVSKGFPLEVSVPREGFTRHLN